MKNKSTFCIDNLGIPPTSRAMAQGDMGQTPSGNSHENPIDFVISSTTY